MIRIGFHTNPTRREFKYSTTQYVELSGLAFWYNSMFHVEALDILSPTHVPPMTPASAGLRRTLA